MSVEERLALAFASSDEEEQSPDLWSRVVHSIEEDRLHRTRLIRTAIASAAVFILLAVVGVAALTDGPYGTHVRWRVMEIIEVVALVVLVFALGPAIRRFGRGYTSDLFTTSRNTGSAMLRLLDLAYYLVFGGYILLSVDLPNSVEIGRMQWAEQLQDAGGRIGGLLLVMGMLHAITLVALPLLAFIVNSTRAGARLPRWIWVLLIVGAIAAWQLTGIPFILLGGE